MTVIEALEVVGAAQTPAAKPTVVEAWADVMAEVTAVAKDGKYDAGKTRYNFRGIDGVMNAVGPALRKHRVIVTPTVLEAQYREVEVGANRTLSRECTVKVRYTVRGPAGDSFDSEVIGEALDSSDKGTAKATSVAYRIFLLQSLTIPTHEPDPDESRYERASAQEPEYDDYTPGLRSSVEAAIAKLDNEQKETLKAWFHENQLPAVRRMNAEQCGFVIEHLVEMAEIDSGEPGASPSSDPTDEAGAESPADSAPALPLEGEQ